MQREEPCQAIITEIIQQFNVQLKKSNLKTNINFDFKKSICVIQQANQLFDKEPTVLTIDIHTPNCSQFIIVGDLHGNLESLVRIINNFGYPPKTRYLFLGDYVDRGNNSREVIIMLYSLKCLYHNDIFLIRGNHEFKNITDLYGFKEECYKRFSNETESELFYNMVTDTFSKLPLCAILNETIFCVHGGISSLIENREQLLKIKKVGDDFTLNDSIQVEFLWNDPTNVYCKYEPSPRGIGSLFGQDALDDFLEKLKFNLVIRGHQNEMNGYNYPFDKEGGILTVFSSLDYCGMLNDAAVAIINTSGDSFKLEIQTFSPLPKSFYKKMHITLPSEILMNAYEPLDISLSQLPKLIF